MGLTQQRWITKSKTFVNANAGLVPSAGVAVGRVQIAKSSTVMPPPVIRNAGSVCGCINTVLDPRPLTWIETLVLFNSRVLLRT